MIILDLDGVLCNFSTAACLVHGLPCDPEPTCWNWYHQYGLTDEDFWSKIHLMGDEFYRDYVRPYPWCLDLLEQVHRADDFVIMTSPSNHPAGYSGKKVWIDKYLPGIPAKQIIVGSQKHLLAGRDRLLIDDNVDNCEAFRKAGGCAFTFPQPWNCEDPLLSNRLVHTRSLLATWGGARRELAEACA